MGAFGVQSTAVEARCESSTSSRMGAWPWLSQVLHGCLAPMSVRWLPDRWQNCNVPSAALPDPSLRLSPNGGPRGPARRYAVHFRQPGPRVSPSVPAWLGR